MTRRQILVTCSPRSYWVLWGKNYCINSCTEGEKSSCCFIPKVGLHHVLGRGVLFPSKGLHHEREKVVLFLCSEAVKSLYSCIKSDWMPFCEVFYFQVRVYIMNWVNCSKIHNWGVLLWIQGEEWIVMQNVEIGACGRLRYSSRYSSWSKIYFWLKNEQPHTWMDRSLFESTW